MHSIGFLSAIFVVAANLLVNLKGFSITVVKLLGNERTTIL